MAPQKKKTLAEQEKYVLDKLHEQFQKISVAPELNFFMHKQMLKPITLNDGRSYETPSTLLKEFEGRPFYEAARSGNGGAHLSTYCFANGMSFDDMLILKNEPNNKRYPEIAKKFEELRKGFFDMACCEDAEKRDQLVTDYYVGLMTKTVDTLDEIKRSGDLGINSFVKFAMIASGFQSLGIQTLKIGSVNGSENASGRHYIDLVNKKLKEMNAPYDFDRFFNTKVFSSTVIQACNFFEEGYVSYDDPEKAEKYEDYISRIQRGAVLVKGLEEFAMFLGTNQSIGKTIAELTDEKAFDIQNVKLAPQVYEDCSFIYAGLIIDEYEATEDTKAFKAHIENFKAFVPALVKTEIDANFQYVLNPAIAKLSGYLATLETSEAEMTDFKNAMVQRQQETYQSIIESYAKALDQREYEDLDEQLQVLESTGNIPQESINKKNEIKQLFCSVFEPYMVQAGNEIPLPENDLASAIRLHFVKNEVAKIKARQANPDSDVDVLLNQVNEKLLRDVINNKDGKAYENYNQLMNKLMSRSWIQELMEYPPEFLPALISDPDKMDELIYGKNFLADMSRDHLTTLYESGRKFGTGIRANSEEYDAIREKLLDINQKRANLEDIDASSYMELYDACSKYVNTRSANAKTQSGKERFAAAAELLYQLGSKIKEDLPAMAEKIDRDFKLTCIRSKSFRDKLIATTKDDKLKEFATVAGSALEAKTKLGMEPDVIKSREREDEILSKVQSLVEKNRLIERNREPSMVLQDMSQNAKQLLQSKIGEPKTPKKTEFIATQIATIVFAQEGLKRSQTKDLTGLIDSNNMEPMLDRIMPFASELAGKLNDKALTKLVSDPKSPEALTKQIEKAIKKAVIENIFDVPQAAQQAAPQKNANQNVL